jgi:hypothetical protein
MVERKLEETQQQMYFYTYLDIRLVQKTAESSDKSIIGYSEYL